MSQLTDLLGPAYGMFDNFACYAWIASVIIGLALGFIGVPFILWGLFSLVVTIGFGAPGWLLLAFLVVTLIGSIKPIRAMLLSGPIMALLKKLEKTTRKDILAEAVVMRSYLRTETIHQSINSNRDRVLIHQTGIEY